MSKVIPNATLVAFGNELAALPAASVPAGLTSAKLPVGLQIVGPRFSEPAILTVAKFVEEEHPIGLPPNCG